MQHHQLGKDGPEVFAIGLGCTIDRTPSQDFHPLSVAQESEHDLVECSGILHGRDVSAIRNHYEFRAGDTVARRIGSDLVERPG
jgi:hypothetical protein